MIPPTFQSFLEAIRSRDLEQVRECVASEPAFVTMRETSGEGWGALHHAAACGNLDAAAVLLDAGCNANLPSGEFIHDGDTDRDGYFEPGVRPIAVATWKDQLAVVKLLLARGADPTGADHFSHSAVHVAATFNRVMILNVLLANGANPNLSSDRRTFDEELDWHFALTALHCAAQSDSVEAARCLLAHGGRMQACSITQRTPLFYAAARGSTGVARVLLEAGANPNAREDRAGYSSRLDYTPLHYAASNGHAETVKVLLEFGADPSARESNQNNTARELAQSARHHSVIAVLDDSPSAGQLRLFP